MHTCTCVCAGVCTCVCVCMKVHTQTHVNTKLHTHIPNFHLRETGFFCRITESLRVLFESRTWPSFRPSRTQYSDRQWHINFSLVYFHMIRTFQSLLIAIPPPASSCQVPVLFMWNWCSGFDKGFLENMSISRFNSLVVMLLCFYHFKTKLLVEI